MRNCSECGAKLPEQYRGRPRVVCSDACRMARKAKGDKVALEKVGPGKPTKAAKAPKETPVPLAQTATKKICVASIAGRQCLRPQSQGAWCQECFNHLMRLQKDLMRTMGAKA